MRLKSETGDETAVWQRRMSGLSRAYGQITVLTDVNLEMDEGEVVSIIGPSDARKSTSSPRAQPAEIDDERPRCDANPNRLDH